MTPLVSVCIPSYNNGLYITETISSVLKQTYGNFELIIVDDNSPDDTVSKIRSFNDRRISFFENERNLGMHGNWSRALSLAKGEYIKLLCGDDIIYPDCLEKQVKVMTDPSNADLAMVVCRRHIITAGGKNTFGSFYKLLPGKYTGKKVLRYCVTAGTNLIGEPMAVLFKGSVFRENHLQLGSNNYLIDFDLYTKLLRYGNLLMMKEHLAGFRIHDVSMTGSLGLKQASMFIEFISDTSLRKEFGIKWHRLLLGKLMARTLSFARNVIIKTA
jgi:glycosyltransferase involved in cell wall biosynthesis